MPHSQKEYSEIYAKIIESVRKDELVTVENGVPYYNHCRTLPPLIMEESDSWGDQMETPLCDLTFIPISSWPKMDAFIARYVWFFRTLRLLGVGALFFPLIGHRWMTRFQYSSTYRDFVKTFNAMPLSAVIKMIPHLNYEILLQTALLGDQKRVIQVAERLAEEGYEHLVARFLDSVTILVFVERFSNLKEKTAQKVLPLLQRPERFHAARRLVFSIDNLSNAIVELMHREASLEKINQDLAENLREVDAKTKQLQRLTDQIKIYVPHQLIEILLGEEHTQSHHKRRKLTVLFSDLKGFIEATDSVRPQEIASILNGYLNAMAEIANRYGGTIDKFIVDAIVIFFGDSNSKGEQTDALNCVKMALEMREKVIELRQQWQNIAVKSPLDIRIGINSGYCTIGDFGAEFRKDYTIIGSEVNLAARLKAVAPPGSIFISHATYSLVKEDVETREKGEISVKGFSQPVKTYEIVSFSGKSQHKIKENGPGFTLELDGERIPAQHKEDIAEILEQAYKMLTMEKDED